MGQEDAVAVEEHAMHSLETFLPLEVHCKCGEQGKDEPTCCLRKGPRVHSPQRALSREQLRRTRDTVDGLLCHVYDTTGRGRYVDNKVMIESA